MGGKEPRKFEVGRCCGTKEMDECDCNGDKDNCTFYPENINKSDNLEDKIYYIITDRDGNIYGVVDSVDKSNYARTKLLEMFPERNYGIGKALLNTIYCDENIAFQISQNGKLVIIIDENESAFENSDHAIIENPIVFSLLEEILTSKYIDPPLRELVYWFNKCSITTQWCCYGHEDYEKCYIIFSTEVNDKQFEELFSIAYENYGLSFGILYKELRMSEDLTKIEPRWEWNAIDKESEIYFMVSSLKEYYKLV